MPTFTRHGEPMARGDFPSLDGQAQHLAYCLDLWSDEYLAAYGIVRTPDAEPQPPTLEDVRFALQERVRQLRWEREVAGIVLGGVPIRTDERSQAKLNGAVTLFMLDPAKTQIDNWEAVPGVFVTLSRAEVEAIGLAVGAHIQACFDRSAALCGEINAAEDAEAAAAIDVAAGWPD